MKEGSPRPALSRRRLLALMGKAGVATVVLPPFLRGSDLLGTAAGGGDPLSAVAGPDRIVVVPGRTYLNGWTGYGEPPWRRRRRDEGPREPEPDGPAPVVRWTRESGPGEVVFADAGSLVTTASFTAPGSYVLKLVAEDDGTTATSSFEVTVEPGPPPASLEPVATREYRIDSRLWGRMAEALMVSWIPHCIDQITRDDLELGPGGLDNFIEAAKALRGEPHGEHKGYVFSNAWVYQTIEAMSIALLVDPRGDAAVMAAQARMRDTLDEWIPIVLAAQHPDGYLHTAFTLRDRSRWRERWTPEGRRHHEGYVAGYFLEAALNHHAMTGGRDTRLYDAAKKLADCWDAHIGPPPKREWFDGHQEMEQALVRFGCYVSHAEGGGAGDRYVRLAKFLLDCRGGGGRYDQSHLPTVQQYEAVGHAVRAVYQYSGMADIALETRDVDYLSATRSLWDSIVNRKYYVTGGIGSGETAEGFGEDYSLPNRSYCESCASCGELFFQSKMNRLYRDARYADLMEETLYNALLGSTDLEGRHYYYDNPLETSIPRYAWHSVPCCVGNIPRTVLMLPTWMYAREANGLYVNLFIGSRATIEDVAGTEIEVIQETEYPWEGRVRLTLNPAEPRRFSLRVRVPDRMVSRLYRLTPAADGIATIALNGSAVEPRIERGYAVITREWSPGDRIELELPLRVQRIHADERIEAARGRVALKYGPLVYNIEAEDQRLDEALSPSAPLTPEWRDDFLGGLVVIRGRFASGAPLLAIPNYARGNRMEGTYGPRRRPRPADGSRPEPFPATSIVWMREG
ncbi:MAG: glycoside hydrolase family 127 protein [Gemmatimonadetes bacterium]|nr:glycoside hydrolase family 127 protein [Gemmatimonadota bacterium]